MDDIPEDYVTPLRTSLTRPILMAGVPRGRALTASIVRVSTAFGREQPLIGAPLWIVLQGCAAWAAARDPWFLETWPRHLAKPSYFAS